MHFQFSKSLARRFVAPFATCLTAIATTHALPAQTADDFAQRLVKLEERIEKERIKLHIPGLALAVVRDDRVVLAKGFGLRDVGAKAPVTPETIFAIGSTSKAFTSTLLGMIKDDGKLDWDDPVAKHLPAFRLDIDTGDEEVTLRDLLCHRTGFTRMGVLWAGATLSRDEVLERVAHAKPLAKFREKFLYNNIMYMSAGHAAGLAAGSTWSDLTRTRIFEALDMRSSSTSIRVAQKDPRLAKGYRWDEASKSFTHLPMRQLDLVGPAGSINSNVLDMAQWIRFQLGRGAIDGKRLLSERAHAETWRRQIRMNASTSYGLGWMLQTWKRTRVVEHGGSIDGFAAQVSLLPRKKLGYVLLCNVTATPLQQKSIGIVFDTLLGEPSADAPSLGGDDRALAGEYLANFASFRDATFRAVWKDGRLALDVPGQRVFELKPPEKDGKRFFELTNQIAVSFQRNDSGEPISLTMYQSGMEFEAPRKGLEPSLQTPLAELQPLTGSYSDEKSGGRLRVLVHRKRLYIDEEKGGRFELAPPTKERSTWAMRANPTRLQIRFERGEDGSVDALTRIQRKREVRMPRVSGADQGSALPSLDDVRALLEKGYGATKLASLGSIRLHGTTRFVHQGASGKSTLLLAGTDRMAAHSDLGKIGSIRIAYDGKRGWQRSTFSADAELEGQALRQLAQKHPLWFLDDLPALLRHARVRGRGNVDGEPTILVRIELPDMPPHDVAVSAKRGFILMEKTTQIIPGVTAFPIRYRHSDFRAVRGVMLPFRSVARSVQMGDVESQYERVEEAGALAPEAFRLVLSSDK